jgi:hypothetical protein
MTSSKDPPRVDHPAAPDLAAESRHQAALKELTDEYDRRLRECFDAPDFGDKVDAMMDACGRTKVRPKAGTSF